MQMMTLIAFVYLPVGKIPTTINSQQVRSIVSGATCICLLSVVHLDWLEHLQLGIVHTQVGESGIHRYPNPIFDVEHNSCVHCHYQVMLVYS